ncbi:MAG TPA: tetratricopeptide repeat protein [Micromonosporaceae bacterium]
MEFLVLGPVRVVADRRDIDLGRRRERLLLGLLLLEPGRTIPASRLIDLLWDGSPPASATEQLRVAASRLRRSLGEATCSIEFRGFGYAVDAAPESIDAAMFVTEVERAARLPEPNEQLVAVDGALARWRGPLLADAASDRLRVQIGRRLTEMRSIAYELRVGAMLALDLAERATAELFDLVAADPMQERLVVLLMRALVASGRQGEALRVYHELRTRLRDEMGVEPGVPVRDLFAEILREDGGTADPTPEMGARREPISQLPADPPTFTGRVDELEQLDKAMSRSNAGTAVGVIVGPGGVGKSTLALRWARTRPHRYPDGHLWVDLHGDSPAAALAPYQVLHRFLRTLGVPLDDIPGDAEEAAGLYRAHLARRHMLVVLDNAGSADQVRPLLPGGSGSSALVTSRNRMTDLVARHGAIRLDLTGLPTPYAIDMLARISGDDRIHGDWSAAADLATICGHLPLALGLAAAQLADEPTRSVRAQAEAIRNGLLLHQGAQAGEPSPVRAVFDWSFGSLGPTEARLFQLIGMCPAATLDVPAATALSGRPLAEVAPSLETLRHAYLLQSTVPGRYGMHDLLHSYARDRAIEADVHGDGAASEAPTAALRRLYDYYVAATTAAAQTVSAQVETATEFAYRFTDQDSAREWLEVEQSNIVSVVRHAAEVSPQHAISLSGILANWLLGSASYADAVSVQRAGGEAAERLGDDIAQADAHRRLGVLAWRDGNLETANAEMQASLRLAERCADSHRIGLALNNLGGVAIRRGATRDALEFLDRALVEYRRRGDLVNEASTTENIGSACWELGDYERAYRNGLRALEAFTEIGSAPEVARALGNVGNVHRQWGQYALARDHQDRALALFRSSGDRAAEAECLADLGLVCALSDDEDAAVAALEEGLAISAMLANPHAEASLHAAYGVLRHRRLEHLLAREHFRRCLTIASEVGLPYARAGAYNGLGAAHLGLDDGCPAATAFQEAYDIADVNGFRFERARALDGIGQCRAADGDVAGAAAAWRDAAESFAALGVPDVDAVRRRLAGN